MTTDIVLMRLDTARKALAEAKTIQETKNILDIAVSAEIYAKRQALGEEAIKYATAIKVEALAQLGRMLKETQRNKGAKGTIVTGDKRVPVMDDTPTLAELGLDKFCALFQSIHIKTQSKILMSHPLLFGNIAGEENGTMLKTISPQKN